MFLYHWNISLSLIYMGHKNYSEWKIRLSVWLPVSLALLSHILIYFNVNKIYFEGEFNFITHLIYLFLILVTWLINKNSIYVLHVKTGSEGGIFRFNTHLICLHWAIKLKNDLVSILSAIISRGTNKINQKTRVMLDRILITLIIILVDSCALVQAVGFHFLINTYLLLSLL